MKVEMWSDFVCPFCYIGKKKFEVVLKDFNLLNNIEINYRSFELDTSKQRDKNINSVEDLASKYGMSKEEAQKVMEETVEKVKDAGLVYDYKNAIPANTFNAHRLNYYAREFKKDSEIARRIFNAHFADGLDIGDLNILSNLAEEAGLNKEDVINMFNSDKYFSEIKKDRKMAIELEIDVVPTYIFNDQYRIAGVLSSKDFAEVLTKIQRK